MRQFLASASSASVFIALALVASPASADDDEPIPRPRPEAPDTRSWRPTLAAGLAYGRLFGSAELTSNQIARAQATYASWGLVPTFTLSLPVSRHVAVEAWALFGSYPNGTNDCQTCTAKTTAGGLGASYHLVDGIPFDPWFSAGVGWRQTTLEDGTPAGKLTYSGVVFPRLTVGSDYYPAPYIGFGPWLDFATGRYFSVTPGPIIEKDVHSAFAVGFRVVLAPFGR